MLTETEFHAEMAQLVASLIPTIHDDYRADEETDTPSMSVTVGADADGWSYQTGDNSFTGGAYGYATWAVTTLERDTDPKAFADDVVSQLHENEDCDAPIFGHWFTSSCGHVEMQISAEHAREGSHQGACDDDIAALRKVPYIKAQLDALDAHKLAEELRGYGAWDEVQLADHDENLSRVLWLACGDIVEELFQTGAPL